MSIAARLLLWLVLAGWLLFALAWGILQSWIVPRIGEFRPRLEIQASQALGVPVRIGAISAQTTGLIPSFELRDVALLDPQGREALHLPLVLASLSPRSLWHRGFEQLYIEQPVIDIRRAADGRLFVAGLDFSKSQSERSGAADWFFSQAEFVIHNGTLRWTDEQRNAPPLALSQVDLVVRNPLRRHQLRLDATPPPAWGGRFSINALFRQPLLSSGQGNWREWDGQAYGDFAQVDVSEVRKYADFGVEIAQGSGALRVWADLSRGDWVGASADLALSEVNLKLGPQLAALDLLSLAGRLSARRLAAGFEFATQGLQFHTRDGMHWPGGNVTLSHSDGEGKIPAQGELMADRLDLAALAQIANSLPLGTTTHAQLIAYAPRGLVEVVQASWQGRLDALTRLRAKGRISGLEIASQPAPSAHNPASSRVEPGRPGVRGMGIDFDLTEAGGHARVTISHGVLELPGVFEDPLLRLDQLSADAQWQISGDELQARLANLSFSNADVQGQAQLAWRTSDPKTSPSHSRFPGILDLQGGFSRADGARVYRYLPTGIPKSVRDYVRDAVLTGSASGVTFTVKGDLHELPFPDAKRGEFHVAADIKNVTYAYVPKGLQARDRAVWPALTQLAGQLVFDRQGMQIKGASSRVLGAGSLQFNRIEVRIPDLGHTTTVFVSADARGPLSDALGIVNGSPLAAMTGQSLSRTTATGMADYKLAIVLPVANVEKAKVQGSVSLSGNDLQFAPGTPVLAGTRGLVSYSEAGFTVSAAQARLLGGELRFEGGMRSPVAGAAAAGEPAVAFRGQGTASAEGLRQSHDLAFIGRLAQSATGSATYTAALNFRRGEPELLVSSSLQGMALNLPAPMNKAAETPLPLRYENALLRDSWQAGQKLQDQLSINLGRLASITYVRDLGAAEPRVLRGSIGVGLAPGESVALPEEGVAANINLTTADLDAWDRVLSSAVGTTVTAVPSPRSGAAVSAGASPALSYLPSSLAVRATELIAQGRKLNQVVIGGTRDGLVWRANVDARELNGYLEYRQASGAGAGRLYARLARLSIAQSTASDVEAVLDEPPTSIPALDIVVDDLDLRGRRLGRVEIEAINRGGAATLREGGVREWRLSKLNILMPEASFIASGSWLAQGPSAAPPAGTRAARSPSERRQTVMNFRLDVADAGELLKRFGMPGVVRKGAGKLEGQVAWTGSPLSLDYPSLNGQFNVNLENGQFLKADPGLAKLLGVLSLQSLPRRLTLDFRDVFSEGFSFDFVRGDIKIEQGLAVTNNLQMKGVNAAVLMEGSADIARETQNLKVVVVPEINAGTASLIATVINPAIGLGTFLAQLFLRRPLMQSNTEEFHIDGTWADPKVTKVVHKSVTTEQKVEGRP